MRETASWASSPGNRASMMANRGRDTAPEMAVRRAVHALGLRYRVSKRPVQSLRRTADLVFAKQRVAVFVDGCFWHGCPEHHTIAKTNAPYWSDKVTKNRERDTETCRALECAGWVVLRYWEHQQAESIAADIALTVRGRASHLQNSAYEGPADR